MTRRPQLSTLFPYTTLSGSEITLSLPLIPMRALTVQGSYVGSLAEMKELLDLVGRTEVPPIPIRERPLADAHAALEDLKHNRDRKSTRLNSSHLVISYAVFC